MIAEFMAELAIECRDAIGEGPVWDEAGQRLIWVDHQKGTIHEARHDVVGGWQEGSRRELGHHVAAVVPRRQGGLVIAHGMKISLMTAEGVQSPFATIPAETEFERINDAKCDPRGRLWLGTLRADFHAGGASLYRIDPDGSVTRTLQGLTLANGLDWSPDGKIFYFTDTLQQRIDAFDFDADHGTIGNRRTLVSFERGAGGANGMTVDREGCIWIALTGGGEVRRFAPDGSLLAKVKFPIPGPTSCAFGGEDYHTLFITSRSGRMPAVAHDLGISETMMECNSPEAGCVFICRPGPAGLASTAFAG